MGFRKWKRIWDSDKTPSVDPGVGKEIGLGDRLEDNERLWKAISEGILSVVSTDHGEAQRKYKTGFWSSLIGFGGINWWLHAMLSEGVNKNRITLEKLVEVCCYNPAKIYGLTPQKGMIEVGSDADLVIVDLNKEVTAPERSPYTTSDINMYAGWKFRGCPTLTMLRGTVIMEDGKSVGKPGFGRYCPSKAR